MSAVRHAWFCAGIECLGGAVSVSLWLATGHSAFLFLAGLAVGCALVISALVLEQYRIDRAARMERIG